jgi:hypothetical protein
MEMIMQLDYQNEIRNIENKLKKAKHEIKYKVEVATRDNLSSVIADAPFALHFTGHGIQNDRLALGPDYMQHKDKGDILLLESETGVADYLFEKELKTLVDLSKDRIQHSHRYEVVFVSSWYSEFTAKIFLASGARHVIWIDEDQRISDRASLRFSQIFYERLFEKRYSVCEAFHQAKDNVKFLINASEAHKFKLIVSDALQTPNSKNPKPHKCFPIPSTVEGTLTKLGHIPFFDTIPSNVEHFQGRQQEMCAVITLLHSNRIVNILGPPGIGKTSLVRNLANHIKDRNLFFDGILYVNLKGCESAHMFLTRLSLAIQTFGKVNEDQIDELRKISSKENSNSDEEAASEEDQEKLRSFITQILLRREVLLVLDGWEDWLEDDGLMFVKQLDYFLETWGDLRLLLTSRKYINKLEHSEEIPYHLYSLSPEASIRLLLDKAPREIRNKEIQDLLNYKIPAGHKIHQLFPTMRQGEVQMTTHPLILMLGGHPQAISLAAPMLESQTLTELFTQLLETNIMDALDIQDKQSYASLRLSLEISLGNLK